MSDSEWIDPRYATLVAAWKRAQQSPEPPPRRAFIIPSKG